MSCRCKNKINNYVDLSQIRPEKWTKLETVLGLTPCGDVIPVQRPDVVLPGDRKKLESIDIDGKGRKALYDDGRYKPVYTTEETDRLMREAGSEVDQRLENYYTKDEADANIKAAIDGIEGGLQSEFRDELKNYYKKEETDKNIGDAAAATEEGLRGEFADAIEGYYTKEQTDANIKAAVDGVEGGLQEEYRNELKNYYTKDETDDKVSGIIVQQLGADEDVVMSQRAVTAAIFADPDKMTRVQIGKEAQAKANYTTALGNFSGVEAVRSVALGSYSEVEADDVLPSDNNNGVVSVGGKSNNTKRRIINVRDGVNGSDAATVSQVSEATASVAADIAGSYLSLDGNAPASAIKGDLYTKGNIYGHHSDNGERRWVSIADMSQWGTVGLGSAQAVTNIVSKSRPGVALENGEKHGVAYIGEVEALQAGTRLEFDNLSADLNAKVEGAEKSLTAKISDAESKLTGKIDDAEALLTAKIEDAGQELTGKISDVEETLSDKISEVETELKDSIRQTDGDIRSKIGEVETVLGEKISDVEVSLSGKINAAGEELEGKIDQSENSLNQKIEDSVSGLETKVKKAVTALDGKIDGVESALTDKIQDIEFALDGKIEGSESSLKAQIEEVESALGQAKDELGTEIEDAKTSLGGKIASVETALGVKVSEVESELKAEIAEVENSLRDKIEVAEQELTGKIDTVDATLSARIESVDSTMQAQIDALEDIVSDNYGELADLSSNVNSSLDTVGGQISSLRTDVDDNKREIVANSTLISELRGDFLAADKFKGYFEKSADIQKIPGESGAYAWSAQTGTVWIYDTDVPGWRDSEDLIPDQTVFPYEGTIRMDGIASNGDANEYARGDHRHPTDTTRAAVADLDNYLALAGNSAMDSITGDLWMESGKKLFVTGAGNSYLGQDVNTQTTVLTAGGSGGLDLRTDLAEVKYNGSEVATVDDVETVVAMAADTYLPLAGGTLTGDIRVKGGNVTIDPDKSVRFAGDGSVRLAYSQANDRLDLDATTTNNGINVTTSPGVATSTFKYNGSEVATVDNIPATLPPSGEAGGDLFGYYPDPTIRLKSVTEDKIADDVNVSKFVNDAGYLTADAMPILKVAQGNLNGQHQVNIGFTPGQVFMVFWERIWLEPSEYELQGSVITVKGTELNIEEGDLVRVLFY